jgi:uncharacterized protein
MEDSVAGAPTGNSLAEPLAERQRISSIDTLRGFALLGILIMNITTFALPGIFDFNPTAIGPMSRLDQTLWVLRFVLFDGKMRAIFSMLFGAGVILLTSRLESRQGSQSADIFARRNLWLTLFGVLHGYFLWMGDILYLYGVTALLFLYPCRRLKARTLLLAGIAASLALTAYTGVRAVRRHSLAGRAAAAASAESAGQALSDPQKDDVKAWQAVFRRTHPDQKALAEEIAEMRGGYFSVLGHYAPITAEVQGTLYYRFGFCDALGMMLIGMGLLRLGFLSGQLSFRTYVSTAVIGYAAGLPVGLFCVWKVWSSRFDPVAMLRWEFLPYEFQRLPVALAHASVILLAVKAGALSGVTRALARVGQTALSNYLGTSLICTLVFNGYGLGLFAKLPFHRVFLVVAAVWVVNLALSTVWLRYFRFGPVEWLWRSLTYWSLQPMLRTEGTSDPRAVASEA